MLAIALALSLPPLAIRRCEIVPTSAAAALPRVQVGSVFYPEEVKRCLNSTNDCSWVLVDRRLDALPSLLQPEADKNANVGTDWYIGRDDVRRHP